MTRHMRNLRILTNYLNILSVKFLTSSECINLFEGKETVVNEVLGPDEAKEVIKNCIAAYKDMYC